MVESSDPSGNKGNRRNRFVYRYGRRAEESAGVHPRASVRGEKNMYIKRKRKARPSPEEARGWGVKGHDEGIENKWVRDSAIFRRCRVFRPGDSALSSALRFHTDPQFPRPTYLPRFRPLTVLYLPRLPRPVVSPSSASVCPAPTVYLSFHVRPPRPLALSPLPVPSAYPRKHGPATRCSCTYGKASSASTLSL